MSVRIFITGGTFDKTYNELTGKLYFKDSHLPEMLELGRCLVPVEIRTLMMIDSLEMEDMDRDLIARHCMEADEDKIIITHGTDTMVETAHALAVGVTDKTVVLTGAMIPYEIANSDALFNLGFACGVAQILTPGVYVAMNGKVFPWDDVQKNRAAGVFQSLS